MIMNAYHIIGLTNLEYGQAMYKPEKLPEIIQTVQKRFLDIQRTGYISARFFRTDDQHGRSFWQDDLADDQKYVFLSVGERYSQSPSFPLDVLFGFIFDARKLLQQGALLNTEGDLMSEYDRIIGKVAEEIAATLPRLPEISKEDLDAFMRMEGSNDPRLREFIRQQSTNPENDLLDAIQDKNLEFPGCREAIQEIQKRMKAVQATYRLSGQVAVEYLRQVEETGNLEILVPNSLDVSQAIGTIQGGKKHSKN